MKILIVDTYYPVFLALVYTQNPELNEWPYQEQWRFLMAECFGTANYYSTNLQQLGHEATEVVANSEPLQRRWGQEHGIRLDGRSGWAVRFRKGWIPWPQRIPSWFYPVLIAQVKDYRPDVLHVQDMNSISASFLREVRPYVGLITSQIASFVPRQADFGEYDLILSSFPHFVDRFQQQGLRSTYFNLGFEPGVLQYLKRTETYYDVVFVGGLSRSHADRIKFLEQLARQQPITWWGYGVENLSSSSPLQATYQGVAWALEMYDKLHNARITLNHHINLAENYANNMRLYESTGVGSMLLTDFKDNLHHLFEPGKEIVAYHSVEECAELIQYYLVHEDERAIIARAGQERTLREHTYYHRMKEFVEIVRQYL